MPKFSIITPGIPPTHEIEKKGKPTGIQGEDSPLPTYTLLTNKDLINEDDGATVITITAEVNSGAPSNTAQTLIISISGSGTPSAVDFASVPNFNLHVPANAMRGQATFTLTPENDSVDEMDETVTVSSTNPLVSTGVNISLQDDDASPTGINLRASTNGIRENDGTQTITIFAEIQTPATTTYAIPQVIPVTVTGTESEGVVKFSTNKKSFNLTLPKETSSASSTITITPVDNLVDEADESISIESTDPVVTGGAIINLIDDDATPVIILNASQATVSESDGPTQVTIRATWDSQIVFPSDQIIPLSIRGSGTASAVDFQPVQNVNLSVPEGESAGAATFTLIPIDDTEDEVHETITVNSASDLVGTPATIILEDDDDAPSNISLDASPSLISEGDGTTSVTVIATIGSGTTFPETRELPIEIAGSGDDNVVEFSSSPGSLSIVFAPGESISSRTSLELTPVDDNEDTEDEVVTLSSSDPAVTQSAFIRLLDDDTNPIISLSNIPTSVLENAGERTITVTATLQNLPSQRKDLTFPITVTGSGKDGAVDFVPVPDFDLILKADKSTASTSFVLRPLDDLHDEPDEIITLASTHEFVINSSKITLLDDDETPTISITATPNFIREDDGATVISVTATVNEKIQFGTEQILPVTVRASGLIDVVDFLPVSNFDIVLPPGTSTTSATFTLTPENDNEDETDEFVRIESSNTLVVENATVMIIDDDDAGQIQLSVAPLAIYEERGPQKVTVTGMITSEQPFSQDRTVPLSIHGSGEPGTVDFEPVADVEMVMKAGLRTATATFNIIPVNDQKVGVDEILTISSTDAVVGSPVTVQLINDDARPDVILVSSPEQIKEDAGPTKVTVTAVIQGNTRFIDSQEIHLDITNDDIPNSVKSLPVTGVVLTIPPEASQGSTELEITPVNNNIHQPNGILTISSENDLVTKSSTIILENDDAEPTGIILSTQPASISESDGATKITIGAMVQGGTTYTIEQVITITAQGSGEADAVDFASIMDFEITIPAQSSEGSTVIELTPENDIDDEQDEIITFRSANPLVTQNGTLTIIDDDLTPTGITASLNPMAVTEDAGQTEVSLTVRLTGNTRYGTDKTLALEGIRSGMQNVVGFSLTLPPVLKLPASQESSSITFLVEPVNNLFDEQNETLTINVSGEGLSSSAELSIIDDDAEPGAFELTITPETIVEGDGPTTVNVTATITGATLYATMQTLDLSVDEPATGAVGFERIPSLQIEVPAAAKSGSSSFILTPLENTIPEADATVTITALHMGRAASATLTIQDDDQSTERIAVVNVALLPVVARAFIASSIGAVGERLRIFRSDSSPQTTGFSNGLSQVAIRLQKNQHPGYPIESPLAAQLNRASFSTSIKERITVWAYADYRALSGNRDDTYLRYDGAVTGLHSGVDMSFGQFLVGLSASRLDSDLNYEHRRNANRLALTNPVEGSYQINARMLTPYLNWSWNAHSGAWTMISFSSGEAEISDPESGREAASTSLQAFSAGVDLRLITTQNGFSLSAQGAAWGGQMSLDQNASRIRELGVNVYRLQMSLQGAYRIRLADRGLLQPFIETGLRNDSGDGHTGAGLKMSGGARLSLPSAGLRVAGHGHVLVLHGANIDEWGFSGTLTYAPGGSTGPSMELRSSNGMQFEDIQEIWEDARWQTRYKHKVAGTRLQSRLGYGFNIKHGFVIPYTGVELGHGIATQMGAECRIGSQLSIRMEAAHHIQSTMYQNSPTVRAIVILR